MKRAILLLFALILGGLAAVYFPGAGRIFLGDGDSIVIPTFPQPQLTRTFIPPSEVLSSQVTVPVRLSMDDLQSIVDRNLLRRHDGDVEFLDGAVRGNLNFRLRREDDVRVVADDGRIKISFPIDFQVRFAGNALAAIVRVPFSVQTDGAINVFITANPSIRRDWTIRTDTEIDFAWVRSPRVNVAGIRIGLQRESDKFLREAIRDNLYRLDDAINREVRLRDVMQREWDNLVVPIRVADSMFLHIDPRGIAASPLEITPDDITLRARMDAGISLSMGLRDIVPGRRRNLPSLEQLAQDIPGDESISLNVKALLNYDSLEQEAMRALSGARVDMGVASVGVNSLRLMGSGENLVAALEISAGGSSGTIYALGEPYFDESTRVLSIRNFDFDQGTRDGLMRTAAWLLRPALVSFLSERLTWELGSKIDHLTDEARNIIALRSLGDEFEFQGTLTSAKFRNLRVTDQGIEIGLNLEGDAALTYTPMR